MLRPVRRPIVAVLAVSGLFVGCGGGPSDTERVHDAVEAFGEASAAKDYQRLCDDLLAPKLTIGAIRVNGDAATADVQSSAQGEKPSRDTLQLVRVGSGWRIASLK